MPLKYIPFESIEEKHLRTLIEDKVAEGKTIDYKLTTYGRADKDKKEFLRDVISFANTAGGHIVIGMEEEEGCPTKLLGLVGINQDEEINRLHSMVLDGIKPRIPNVQMKAVTLSSGCIALVIHIPASWASPHMLSFAESSHFYGRKSNGRYPLDVGEIRAAFLLSETLSKRVRDFRTERLGKIISREVPSKIGEGFVVALHIIPFRAFDHGNQVDLELLRTPPACFNTLTLEAGCNHRFNFDGLLAFNDEGYLQIFRNGCLEAVHAFAPSSGTKIIGGPMIEGEVIIKSTEKYINFLTLAGQTPPFFIMLSFHGVAGYAIWNSEEFGRGRGGPIDRDTLVIPEVLIEDSNADIPAVMKPAFDALWNASGWPGSPSYKNGVWTGRI